MKLDLRVGQKAKVCFNIFYEIKKHVDIPKKVFRSNLWEVAF